jgi:hypothetical protein
MVWRRWLSAPLAIRDMAGSATTFAANAEIDGEETSWRASPQFLYKRPAVKIGCRTFRAAGITAYLEAGGTLKTPSSWPRTKVRAPPRSTIVPATRSRSMRSSGLRFQVELRSSTKDYDAQKKEVKFPVALRWETHADVRIKVTDQSTSN